MLAELVFVTRLLGLMSGTPAIEARVDPAVHSVEILLEASAPTSCAPHPGARRSTSVWSSRRTS